MPMFRGIHNSNYVTFYNGNLPIIGKDKHLLLSNRNSLVTSHNAAIDRIRELNDNKTITGYTLTINNVTSVLYNVTIKENK